MTLSSPWVARACSLRLRLKCDEPLSIFAFNFNLRRYIKAAFSDYVARKTEYDAGAYTPPLLSST